MQGRKRIVILLAGVIAVTLAVLGIIFIKFQSNTDALWKIVSQQCVAGSQQKNNPAPCTLVNEADGYVVLKDRNGPLQFLLLPIAKIPGIESPKLQSPATPNFLAESWRARHFMEERRGEKIDDRVYSLAVNSRWGRTQNQLHVHISCLRRDIRARLDAMDSSLNEQWQPHQLGEHSYFIRSITRDELKRTSPFIRIAAELPEARDNMENYGVAIAALSDGRRALMVTKRNLLQLNRGFAEELQDHGCALLQNKQAG